MIIEKTYKIIKKNVKNGTKLEDNQWFALMVTGIQDDIGEREALEKTSDKIYISKNDKNNPKYPFGYPFGNISKGRGYAVVLEINNKDINSFCKLSNI